MRKARTVCLALVCILLLQPLMPLCSFAEEPEGSRGNGTGDIDVLRIALLQDLPNFNNWDLNSNSVGKDLVLGKWCWEGLTGLDPGGNIYPRLAYEWTFDDSDRDNLTINVKLREDVKFHDGVSMDADDVIFTYSALRDGTTYSSPIIDAFDTDYDGCSPEEIDGTIDANGDGSFEGITKIDQYNVRMIMGKPYGQFFSRTLGVPIIPEHIWKDHLYKGIVDILWNNEPSATIGTGPMHYHSGEPDVFRRIEAFEDYWGKDFTTPSGHYIYPQEVDGIHFTPYSSMEKALVALKSGQVDHIPWTVTPGYVPDLINNPNTDVPSISDNDFYYMAFNMKREPMNLLAFRRAVSHAIDKETIVESYLGGYATLGDSCLPPFWSDWYNTSVKQYHYDLELAKAELESAGFTGIGTQLMMPDGEPVPALVLLTPPYDYDPMCIKAAENVANNLRDLGMDVVAKPVDPDTLWQKMNAYDYDMSINCMVWGLSSDPVGNVFDMFAPMASLNHYGWWPVDHEYENPWYNMFGGISTRADNTSQALAIEFHELGILAKESLDREEQIHYTKEAQGVFSEAVPCNILAYPIYNYAIYTGWPGWRGYVVHLGELLNIYSLGALHRGVGPPEIDELNMFLNVPDKIPLGTTVPASVVVFDDRGRPIGDVDVSVSGAGVDLEGTGSGTTDVEGTFRFSVKGTGEGYTTITAHVDHDGNGDEKNRSITVVPGVPRMAFLQVMPDKLFLGPGESTIVDLLLLDGEGDPYVGGVIKLDEGMMGHGQVSATEYISDADGMASFTYTAPDQAPLNEHVVAYLSLRADPMENDLLPDKVNMVVQPIVVMNTGPSSWEMVRITDVTNVACDAANTTTEITIMVVDETGDPVEGATITAEFTNMDAIESADEEIMTNSTGHAVFKVVWDGTADTNATQMFFENGYISNGVGACVQLLFKGTTIKELYGGYTTLSVDGAPMMHPDDGGDLTFDIWIYDIDGNPADVDTAIIIGESADVSTAAMVDAPDYIMNSLLDFAGINIFTNADKGVMSSAGYFISTIMSDAELAGLQGSNLFETWKEPNTENYYEWWWGADLSDPETYPPFDDMEPFTVSGGHAQVSIEADSVVLSDNVPSLTVVPMGKAGFYATYDFSAWWWEFHGETAWRTEFVMQRTDKVYSVKNEVDNGILRPFGPGNVTEMRATVLDSTNEPVEGMDVTVHGSMWNNFWGHSYGSSYLDVGEPSPTDTTGTASFHVTGLPAFTEWHGNTPLTTLEKENLIIEPEPTYGATIQASMEVFILPLQLYTLVEVEPMVSQLGIVTEAEVTVTVTDGSGDRVPDADVALSCDRAAIITSSNLTDDQGQVTAVLEIPWVTTEEPFALPMIYIVAEKEAYVAGYSSLSSLYFLNLHPEISDVSIPETGHVAREVNWSITGNATDDWGLEQVTASLDDSEPVVLTMTDDTWSFDMVDLAPGEHTVVFLAEDRGGRTATHEVTFVVNQLPEISVAVPKVGQKVNGTVEFSGATSDDLGVESVEWRIDGSAWSTASGTEGWTVDIDTTTLSHGDHTLEVRCYDGIEHCEPVTVTFFVNQLPKVTIADHIDGQRYKDEVKFAGTASDDSGVSSVDVRIDEGEWFYKVGTDSWTYHVDATGLDKGEHSLDVRVVDDDGESTVMSTTFEFKVSEEVETSSWIYLLIVVSIIFVVIIAVMYYRQRGL